MAKFNKNTSKTNTPANSVNLAGGAAYERNDFKKELASIILSSMLGDSFYESEKKRLENIEKLVVDNLDNSLFTAKAMVYTRNEGNLRSVSHFLANVLAENVKGSAFMKPALIKSTIRPDDLTEIVGLWNSRNPGKMIPNALRKAIKEGLENKWTGYHLKKYFGNGNVKVSNLINISHPTPKNDEQRVLFKQALENKLPKIDTAQTVNADLKGEERAEKYAEMLKEKTLGYMALLKNLKNILEAGVSDETVQNICSLLRNKNAVLKSKVLPFRFVQAYNIVDSMEIDKFKSKKILKAIEDGFVISAGNINIVEKDEKIALLLDESGSMQGWGNYSAGKSPFDIGKALMAAMLSGVDKSNALGMLWADDCSNVNIDKSPMTFIKETTTKGGGTDIGAPLKKLISTSTFVDKIVVLTDMQMYDEWGNLGETFEKYLKKYRKINPDVKVLFWNLEGYGKATPLKMNHNVLEVCGYSDKMLEIVPKIWKNQNALIDEIEAIKL